MKKNDKSINGILQKFIDPIGGHNSNNLFYKFIIDIIKAIWSPFMCLLERKRNIHPVNNK